MRGGERGYIIRTSTRGITDRHAGVDNTAWSERGGILTGLAQGGSPTCRVDNTAWSDCTSLVLWEASTPNPSPCLSPGANPSP